MKKKKKFVVVRGGGDIATGTIYKLCKSGFLVCVLEIEHPSAIRRYVAFSEAVYEKEAKVEDMVCTCVSSWEEAEKVMQEGRPAMMVDPECKLLKEHRPDVLIDAILAKKNLGTTIDIADLTIALGPGFTAGQDVNYVIETMRGHNLGRIITKGNAILNTGVPGMIKGYGKERVIHSPDEGIIRNKCKIGDAVKKGDCIAVIQKETEEIAVEASLNGVLRGLIRDGYPVTKGFKIADIDPREEEKINCFTISDKARCIAGGVLEAILRAEER